MKKILYLLLLTVIISACDGNGTKRSETGSDSLASEALTWDSLCMDTIYKLPCESTNGPQYHVEIKMLSPVSDTNVGKVINSAISELVFQRGEGVLLKNSAIAFADSLIEDFKKEMMEMYEPENEDYYSFQYEWLIKGSLEAKSLSGYLCYTVLQDMYLGGAHGSHIVSVANFDADTGLLLKIDDVIDMEKEQKVLELMECQLLKDNGYETMEELQENTGITMLAPLYLKDVIYQLLDDGICFIYNQYDIAPYASGTVSVKLSYDQLKDMLKLKVTK